jgi:hypothetical protein
MPSTNVGKHSFGFKEVFFGKNTLNIIEEKKDCCPK